LARKSLIPNAQFLFFDLLILIWSTFCDLHLGDVGG
jgi:hypothetical protein